MQLLQQAALIAAWGHYLVLWMLSVVASVCFKIQGCGIVVLLDKFECGNIVTAWSWCWRGYWRRYWSKAGPTGALEAEAEGLTLAVGLWLVSSSLGSKEGNWLGWSLGWKLGCWLGSILGSTLGWSLGHLLGFVRYQSIDNKNIYHKHKIIILFRKYKTSLFLRINWINPPQRFPTRIILCNQHIYFFFTSSLSR